MFGIEDEALIECLETLRKRLCLYGSMATTCDCKFGASGKGEESGCPEIRQAIAYLRGQHDAVFVWRYNQEATAQRALRTIQQALEEALEQPTDSMAPAIARRNPLPHE
jgi:hypothetical protein